MTEEEAKQKACCGPMAILMAPVTQNGTDVHVGAFNCIGSECMAWRATDNEFIPELPQNEGTTVRVPQRGQPAGYCGLAGKP